ncbi:Uncharacterized protein TCM_009366 [Theobroma cacao]|uniref:Uncharacterized protein n=1 Tax=Theobroma cacao TaxID=3641 RepID=A0A061E4W1_THECC|nr:Uncharacterized protein TCM_009366 [Theobroma cacao]
MNRTYTSQPRPSCPVIVKIWLWLQFKISFLRESLNEVSIILTSFGEFKSNGTVYDETSSIWRKELYEANYINIDTNQMLT